MADAEVQGVGEEQGQQGEVIFVRNQSELAEKLGVDRRTISRYLKVKDNPGRAADGRYNVAAWQVWHGKQPNTRVRKGPDRESLDIRERQLRIDRMEMEMAEALGKLNSEEETCNVLSNVFGALVQRFVSLQHELAPALVGVSVAEATKRLKQSFTDVFTEMSLGGWAKKKAFWRNVSLHLSSLQERYCPMNGLAERSSSTPESGGIVTLSS